MVVDEGKLLKGSTIPATIYANQSIPAQAQMELSARSLPDITVSQQGYINLIKASWILIDVIVRHPQLNLIDSGIRCDVELLANVRPTNNLSWAGDPVLTARRPLGVN